MSIGTASLASLVTTYSNVGRLDAAANMATFIRSGGQSGALSFAQAELDQIAGADGEQKWGTKWLDSYRTVLIQRAQNLQKRLNNLYSQQLAANLYSEIKNNPNYSMANMPTMSAKDSPGNWDRGITKGQDDSLFSMYQPFVAGEHVKAKKRNRIKQDPSSYEFGLPSPSGNIFKGADWGPIDNTNDPNWASDWNSRQYDKPAAPSEFPNPLKFIKTWNPIGGGSPPPGIPLIPPLVFFDLEGFVGQMLMPLFYPMVFYRFETFAHAEAEGLGIDAGVIRSDYNFKTKGFTQFPIIGQLMGGALSVFAAAVAAAKPGLDPDRAIDVLMNPQSAAMAPQTVETETGAFFTATRALQDWDLQEMEYSYFSAAAYQQDFIDTDFLSSIGTLGEEGISTIIMAILKVAGPLTILSTFPISLITDQIVKFIADKIMDMLLAPMQGGVELDDLETTGGANAGKSTSAGNATHIGEDPQLAGLSRVIQQGGFAAGYSLNYENPGSGLGSHVASSSLNNVQIYTKTKKLTDIWDGYGEMMVNDTNVKNFAGVSSRLTGKGYDGNPGIDLGEFRTGVSAGTINRGGMGAYNRALDDYLLKIVTGAGTAVDFGNRVLNPSFGGLTKMMDLDTTRKDSFFEGSISRAPWDRGGDGAPDTANAAYVYFGAGTPPAGFPSHIVPAGSPTGLTAANAGSVTFDGTTPNPQSYTFNALPGGGLRIHYVGPDGLTGPNDNERVKPINQEAVRDFRNYIVTDANGNRVTAQVPTNVQAAAITHPLPAGWSGGPMVTMPPPLLNLDMIGQDPDPNLPPKPVPGASVPGAFGDPSWTNVNGWYVSEAADRQGGTQTGAPARRIVTSPHDGKMYWADYQGNSQQSSTNKQLPDVVTFNKQFNIAGNVLPGALVEIQVNGTNIGEPDMRYDEVSGPLGIKIPMGFSFPDQFELTLTSAKYPGGRTLPLLSEEAAAESGGFVTESEFVPYHNSVVSNPPGGIPKQVGGGKFAIPSDYLANGNNELELKVTKGGAYFSYLIAEPPANQTVLADRQAAGFWVSNTTVNGHPAGTLFYENNAVGGPSVDGRTYYYSGGTSQGKTTIKRTGLPPGSGIDGQVTITDIATARQPNSTRVLPNGAIGYQLKADQRAGISIQTDETTALVETYQLTTVDRYTFDPVTQQLIDTFQTHPLGPEELAEYREPFWAGGPTGNMDRPFVPPPTVANANGNLVVPGQGAVIRSPVGDVVSREGEDLLGRTRTDARQTFGSDSNVITRELFAAMKVIDLDGENVRAYQEYRDCFNMGYLDHIYIAGSAYAPTGGGISSFMEFRWSTNNLDADGNYKTLTSNRVADYTRNWEYFLSDDDRDYRNGRTKRMTVRQADLLMNSFFAFRAE